MYGLHQSDHYGPLLSKLFKNDNQTILRRPTRTVTERRTLPYMQHLSHQWYCVCCARKIQGCCFSSFSRLLRQQNASHSAKNCATWVKAAIQACIDILRVGSLLACPKSQTMSSADLGISLDTLPGARSTSASWDHNLKGKAILCHYR